MSDRLAYHVLPQGTGGWLVQRDGADRPVSAHVTKGQAVAKAERLVAADPDGRVILHRPDGTVQTEWTPGDGLIQITRGKYGS